MRKGVSSPFGELIGSGGNPGSVICEIRGNLAAAVQEPHTEEKGL